jgi:hypothetical protein
LPWLLLLLSAPPLTKLGITDEAWDVGASQSSWAFSQLHEHIISELHEVKYKNGGSQMLSINTSKLLFLSLKNSLVIVFTTLNHKNESPQIFERNSPSKPVSSVPGVHLL